MTRLPTVSVAGVLFSEDRSSVLLIQRRDVPVWVLPGGGVEAGEDPIKAIEREMYEETGFIVSAGRLVGDYSPINRLAKQTQLFECTIKSQENLYRNNPKNRFLAASVLPQNFCLRSRLASGNARSPQTKNSEEPLCQHPDSSGISDNPECKALQFFPLNKLPKHIPPPYRDWIADAYVEQPPVSKQLSQVNYARFVWYLVSHPILVIRFLLARLGKPINT